MTDTLLEARELAREIREGLPGVTPGPYYLDPEMNDYGNQSPDAPVLGTIISATTHDHLAVMVSDLAEAEANAAHVSRLYPQNIAKLLDALEYLSDAYTRGLQDGIAAERERCVGIALAEPEFPGEPSSLVVALMDSLGPVENARSACRTTKKSIAKAILTEEKKP